MSQSLNLLKNVTSFNFWFKIQVFLYIQMKSASHTSIILYFGQCITICGPEFQCTSVIAYSCFCLLYKYFYWQHQQGKWNRNSRSADAQRQRTAKGANRWVKQQGSKCTNQSYWKSTNHSRASCSQGHARPVDLIAWRRLAVCSRNVAIYITRDSIVTMKQIYQ